MFKYHALSIPAVAGPSLEGSFPANSESHPVSAAKSSKTASAFLGRASSRPAPRQRIVWSDDDEDLHIPQVLRGPVDLQGRTPPMDALRSKIGWPKTRLLTVAFPGLVGLGLLIGGAITVFGSNTPVKEDRAVKVEAISLQPAYEAADTFTPKEAAKEEKGLAVDANFFKTRFGVADTGSPASSALQQKIQDRIEQDHLKPTPSVVPFETDAKALAGAYPDAVLGYTPTLSPHAKSSAGLEAIASATAARAGTSKPAGAAEQLTAANQTSPAAPENSLAKNSSFETAKVTQDVNFRSSEDKDAEVLGVIAKDTDVSVGSCGKWWCSVVFNGQPGFVGRKFIEGKG